MLGGAPRTYALVVKVLVVDDDPSLLVLLKHIVNAWGHEPLTAASAAEARQLITDESPEVMFLDVSMPDIDGVEFLRQIRADGLEPPHVALLSALPQDHLEELSRELKVRYIRKPFNSTSLREEFQRLLGKPA